MGVFVELTATNDRLQYHIRIERGGYELYNSAVPILERRRLSTNYTLANLMMALERLRTW